MAAKGEEVQDVVLVEVGGINQSGKINVDFDQTLFLHFTQDCTFLCTIPESFLPNLPTGQNFSAGTLWGPAYADEDYNGKSVYWDAPPQSAASGATTSPAVATSTANVIHVGSGGSTVSFFDTLTKSHSALATSVLCDNWRAAEILLKFIKKNGKNLAPSNTTAITSLLQDGAKAYKVMKCKG